MRRASRAEIGERIEQIVPLLLDGLRGRELHILLAKTPWGAVTSLAQRKRYVVKAQERIAQAAVIDLPLEIGKAMLRNERALARAAAKGDLRAYVAANRAQADLLGLPAPMRIEQVGGLDIAALRSQLSDEIAEALSDDGPD